MPMRKLDVVDRNGTLFKSTIKHEKKRPSKKSYLAKLSG